MAERVTKKMKGALPKDVIAAADGTFATHIAMCESSDPREVLVGMKYIREQMSLEYNPPIDAVVRSAVLPTLVKWMRNYDCPAIQFEASWAISNVASGSSECVKAVVDANTVEVWVEHLRSPILELVDQALWGIGNVVGEGQHYRDFCIKEGALQGILEALSNPEKTDSVSRNGVWAMSNFCRSKYLPSHVVGPIVQAAVHFALSSEAEASLDAMWALNYLSDLENHVEGPHYILQGGALPAVMVSIDSILEQNPMCRVPLLRTLGNLSSGDDTLAVANVPGVLQFLHSAITNCNGGFTAKDQREAMWAVSNLAADSGKDGEKCIQLLLDCGFAPLIFSALGEFTTNYPFAKEALFATTNIISCGPVRFIVGLVEMGVLPLLIQWLKHDANPQIQSNCLEGIQNILESECGPSCIPVFEEQGILEVLHHLCSSNSRGVVDMASQIGNMYVLFRGD